MRALYLLLSLCVLGFGESPTAHAQQAKRSRKTPVAGAVNGAENSPGRVDTVLYGMLKYRNIGPSRGGRASAIAGVPSEPNLFYMGTAGGGVWRSTDGGRDWEPISDEYFGGTVGGLAVAPSDPNVIYAGGGEQTLRGGHHRSGGSPSLWRPRT